MRSKFNTEDFPRTSYCKDEIFMEACSSSISRTHANECMFHYFECLSRKTHNKVLKIAYRQACFSTDPCKRECEPTQEPVCDSASVTHPNMCMFVTPLLSAIHEFCHCKR
uniref:GDNF/GAS1 domain-containing protein n=1 Tax=Ascaris lumbricoides TaxID=6252 RepID=A0A0M3HU25_ASCLU